MLVKKNKIIVLIITILLLLFLTSCSTSLSDFNINTVSIINISIGDTYTFESYTYISTDEEVFKIDSYEGKAISEGIAYVKDYDSNINLYKVIVNNDPSYITVKGDNWIKPNTITSLESIVSPISASQEVYYSSSDESIITINDKGELRSLDKEGYVTITVTSKVNSNVYTEYPILVENSDETYYEPIVKNEIINSDSETLDSSNLNDLLDKFTDTLKQSVVGVEKYSKTELGVTTLSDFGSGAIYRLDLVLNDGSIVSNVSDISLYNNIKNFKYYVITTRYLTKDAEKIKVYLGEDNIVDASLVQYDPKIDLAVITFESKMYYPSIKLGDSDSISQGEFIISIGNSYGKEYFRTSNVGVISSTKRYISTDTDNDDASDWDSEYIQHDAAINDGDNGGIVVNLKGEVIGINDTKITSSKIAYNCMSLCIPSNLVKNIVSMLEQGIQPDRPILGVTIIDVRNYYKNTLYYQGLYPEMASIPLDLEYGFYVNSVDETGVANMAGVQVGDILLNFNGVTTKYSYMLRSELGKFMYGSGQKAELVILRNGETITLEVTF